MENKKMKKYLNYAIIILIAVLINQGIFMAIDQNDNLTPNVLENQPSPYDVVQNNNVLPRNLFTSGMLPGNTEIRIGENNILISGKDSKITVGDSINIDGTNDRMTVSDGTNDRLLMSASKIALSQAGNDVKTATNDKLIWSSDFNMMKIVGKTNITVVVPAPARAGIVLTTTYAHGLGYTPSIIAYANIGSKQVICPAMDFLDGGPTALVPIVSATAAADSTNITATVTVATGIPLSNVVFTVYMFRETAN